MSFASDYYEAKKKRKKDKETLTGGNTFSDEYSAAKERLTEAEETVSFFQGVEKTLSKDDDIAPVVSSKKEDERTWFQKSGLWDDGYQFGDVIKTILGTATDTTENFGTGIIGMGEKALDGLMTLGAMMNEQKMMEAAQNEIIYNAISGKKESATNVLQRYTEVQDQVEKGTEEFVAKDLYDEEQVAKSIISEPVKSVTGIDAETDSVFGEKSDSVAQAGGQLAGTVLLQAAHVPWWLTTGVTAFGSEAENAFNQGATFDEAVLSSTISAGSEILTEKISGGIKFGGGTLDDVLTKQLANKISNKFVRTGLKLGLDTVGEGAEEWITEDISRFGQWLTYRDEEELKELLFSEEAMDEKIEAFLGGAILGGGMSSVNAVKSASQGVDYVSGLTQNEQKIVDKEYKDRVAEKEKNGKLTQKEKSEIYNSVLNDMEKGYISTDTIESVLGGETYKSYQDTVDSEVALQKEFDTLNKMKQGEMTGEQIDRRAELKQQLEELKNNSQRDQLKQQLSDEVFTLAKDSRLVESYNEKARRGTAFEADLTKYDAKQQAVVQKAVESGILNNTNRTHEFVDMVAKISADKGVLFDFTNNEKLKESGFAVDGKTVNGYVTKDGITVNMDSAKYVNSVVGHEITHVLEGTELYAELQSAVTTYAKSKGDYQGRYDALAELYKDIADADIDAELTADLVGDYLFTDSEFINRLSTENRNVFQKIYDEIKYLYKVATAGSKEARELEKVKRAFDKAYRESGKASTDTKYSLSDSDGKQLSKEQQDYFKDSKMRDENGNLKVMYHGSQEAGFHEFSGRYSDDDISFFFVDRNDVAASYSGTTETYEAKTINSAEDMNNFLAEIGYEHYEAVERNGKFELLENNEHVAYSDTAQGIYNEFCWYEGVGQGDANYKVYLNLKNPLVIDAKGRPWNKIDAEFSQEVYDKFQSLTAEEKAALVDLAEWEDFRVFNSEIQEARDNELASAYAKLDDVNIYDIFSVAADNFSEESTRENARKYLNTREYAQRAHAQGYDGVIFNNIIDNGGYSNGSEGASTVAIAFESNQIKSVANEKPTADADIRFSLSEAVEETDKLMALHNLTTEKLLKSLELGGLPMPSIAITKDSIPHDNFGDITLIFGKDTIDPKANKKNVVYSADAWTPVFPQVEYEADGDVESRINKRVQELEAKIDETFKNDLYTYKYGYGLEDSLNRYGGEEGLIRNAMEKYGLKAAFLEEQGHHIDKVTKQVEVDKGYNTANEAKYESIAAILGVDSAEEIGNLNLQDVRDNYGEQLESIYQGITKSPIRMSSILGSVKAYLENRSGEPAYKTVTDVAAMRKAVDDALDVKYFEEWTRDLFSGIVKDSGIYNQKDIFTPSGNRRSFKQTHLPATLENIVKAMAAQNNGNTKNVAGFNGVKSLRAGTAERFKSIEAMHESKGRLQHLTQEEADKINDDLSSRLYSIIETVDRENGNKGESNSFIRFDTIGETLMEISESGRYDVADIQQVFSQYGREVSDATATDIKQLLYDVAQMPVNIYEAKPERAVSFDEAGVFVIPYNADAKLKQELLNRGYAIAEYDPQIEGDRQKVVNQFEEYKFSLSNVGETPKSFGNYRVSGKDLLLEQEIAPVAEETPTDNKATTDNVVPDGFAPITEAEADALREDSFASLDDADMPPEVEPSYRGEKLRMGNPLDPFASRDIFEVGNRKVKAYMYENPEVKPFFQEAAYGMLDDLRNTIKGERWYNDKLYYETGGELGFSGTKRTTTDDIAYLLDNFHYTYEQIENGLNAIIEDNGAENNAVSKKIEFMLNDRLKDGYTGVFGEPIPRNEDYVKLLEEKQINEYSKEAFDSLMANADDYAPYVEEEATPHIVENVAPSVAPKTDDVATAPVVEETAPEQEEQIARLRRADTKKKDGSWWSRTKKKINDIITLTGDKGWAIENLSKKTGNRELEAKYDFMKNRSRGVAQEYINDHLLPILDKVQEAGKKNQNVSPVVEVNGDTVTDYQDQWEYYTKHLLNIDRMSLETAEEAARRAEVRKQLSGYTENQIKRIATETITRETPKDRLEEIYLAREYVDLGGAKGKNKPVFGRSVTADVSLKMVAEYEAIHPEFKELVQEIYDYNKGMLDKAVEAGLIKRSVADKWAKTYAHYVPLRRVDKQGNAVNVPLDANKTGVNTPFKRATGGNSDFEPLLETMAANTEQIFRAIHRNSFGVELMNTLGVKEQLGGQDVSAAEILESVEENDNAVLKKGENGNNPQFTVFVDGKRVTFDITEEIFNAMKQTEGVLAKTYAPLNKLASGYKKVLTEFDPFFTLFRNPVKDTKDVFFNSRHALKTYATAPKTMHQIATKGNYFTEYVKNGGKTTSYYDGEKHEFKPKQGAIKKVVGFPLAKYKQAAENVEMFWRLSEYIASRESGASIEVAMLDSARVTTNFGAGGDLTKWANRNGAMFLNPSVQGAMQAARNVREAYHGGIKGSVILAAKVLATGLGGMFFNWLLWDDDEDYEELSDYVKQNYYVVWKTEDGKFIRIPKGRMEAVIQGGFEQMDNLITGDDDVDLATFAELVANNIAPNNPLENNLIAPVKQALSNKTWYGEDLVPTRLQDLPAAEQYDESTDTISKWVGEKTGISPYKFNYVMNQYGGGFADVLLPMLTPEAESGDNSLAGNLLAPIKNALTTDSVMNNQNVSDFYDKVDELTTNAKSSKATDEDILKYKYINSVNADLGELYAQKREIQNGYLADDEKYAQVRAIQQQIDELAKESLNTYNNVSINGEYATVGDTHYRWYEPSADSDAEAGWQKINDKQLEKQEEVTSGLGISASEYWSNKEEYDYAYEYPEKYAVAKSVGGYEAFKTYSSELYDIKADKDEDGKSISGSRKEKVIEYVNNLDADYGTKIILFKNEYNADDTYNEDIIDYLNEREDISYEEMETILKKLGFTVSADGTVTW